MMDKRAQQAIREVGTTTIGRPTALVLAAAFVALISLGPLTWLVRETDRSGGALSEQRSAVTLLGDACRDAWHELRGGHFFVANRTLRRGLGAYENRLEESKLATATRPATQSLLTHFGGSGNQQVYVGHAGWLLLKPAVDHLTAPGFLSRRHQRQRGGAITDSGDSPASDPVRAIVDFAEQLEARGIHLLVVPTPGKATVHPAALTRLATLGSTDRPIVNADHDRFAALLEEAGVSVFDPAPLLLAATADDSLAAYLEHDSHWRPEAVELVAWELAVKITDLLQLDATSAFRVERIDPVEITNQGDLTRALELPDGQKFLAPETVSISSVSAPFLSADASTTFALWRPDPGAEILLLGDSFTNIYSRPDLGWGQSAGLAEQISFYLQLPLDRIAINAGGAFTTRQRLAQHLDRGEDRLAGKRLVIYQFASRELTVGDWRMIEMGRGD